MATKIYLPSSGSAPVTPSTWIFANQINPLTFEGVTTPINSARTTKTEATGTTSPTTRAMLRYVIGPLSAQSISGTVRMIMITRESNAGANANLAMAVKIIQPNGADRATLLGVTSSDSASAPYELTTILSTKLAYTSAEAEPLTLTTQSASEGDYLVIEIGFRSATTTSRNIDLRYGDDAGSDFAYTAGLTTDLNPWVEFSATLQFPVPPTTIQLDTATITAQGQSFGVVEGDVAVVLDTATISVDGIGLTVSAPPSSVSVQLATALLTASGQALSVLEGDVSVLLDTATINLAGQSIGIDPGSIPPTVIQLATAVISLSGQSLSVVEGSVSVQLSTAVITANGISFIVDEGFAPIVIVLNTANINSNGQALSVSPGPVSVLLNTAIIPISGIGISVVSGAADRIVVLNTAQITANGIAVDVAAGSVSVLLDTALISVGANSLDLLAGAVSVLLDTATITLSGTNLNIDSSVVINLNTAVITANPVSFDVQAGEVVIELDTAIVTAVANLLAVLQGGTIPDSIFIAMCIGVNKRTS